MQQQTKLQSYQEPKEKEKKVNAATDKTKIKKKSDLQIISSKDRKKIISIH